MAKSDVDKRGDSIKGKVAVSKSKAKKKKSGGDYDGWILRMIDKIEDLQFMYNLQDWLEFAADKITDKQGYELTDRQIRVLDEKRDLSFEVIPDRLSIRPEFIVRYRGEGGRFTTKKEVTATPETRTRYRNVGKAYGQKTGTMVAKAKINEQIKRMKSDKSWEKL